LWLIVGLGNPGSRYSRTRHNVGFWVVEDLTSKSHREFREKSDYRICDGSIEDQKVILLEPLTYMNRSGTALRKVMDKFTILPENLIVIHDDLDLETGKVRIRKKGSSGGHRGVESIIQNIGTNSFIRIKIGIGRSPFISAEDYVLAKFRREEIPLIRKAVDRAVDSIHAVISEGVEKAMNRFNVF
jgi:peptidyl-tRNA hydrolase, PTH1 family